MSLTNDRNLTPISYTSKDAARVIGIGEGTLRNRRSLGKGPVYVRTGGVGSRIFYLRSDLEKWLQSHRIAGGGRP